MFEVGKKYRYTGKGKTSFNSRGLMDYLKEGEHKVEAVEFNRGIFTDNPYVRFSDDPVQNSWFVDPADFEEVIEEMVFSIYQYAEDIGGTPEKALCGISWPLNCDGKTVQECNDNGYFILRDWLVPKSEFVPYKKPMFKVGSYYKWNGGQHLYIPKEVRETKYFKVLKVHEDGTTQPYVEFEGFAFGMYCDIRDFDEVVSQQEKKTLFVGFETLNNRHVILVVPKEDAEDECGKGHTFGYVSFSEAGQFGYPNWFWGGDVYESLNDAVTALSRIDAEPIYFDSMKSLMKWATELL